MASILQKPDSANKSWVELCEEESQSPAKNNVQDAKILQVPSSANKSWAELCEEESQSPVKNNVKKNLEQAYTTRVTTCPVMKEVNNKGLDENTPAKRSAESASKVTKTEEEINPGKNESPWRFSYASILRNSASKDNINASPHTPTKLIVDKVETIESAEGTTLTKTVKREIQQDFLQEDLSLTSHLDVFHMQSPLKLETVDEEMSSPVKVGRSSKKRLCPPKLSLSEDAVMPDDVLMPSPKKVTRLSSRRKREPGESPLTNKRSKQNSSTDHSTPRCVLPFEPPPVELETDEQILLRRQKQIDYGKNTIGYERFCQMVPKQKRSRKHPQTPPRNIKYSRRAWDGLIRQWRQQLHFWDPPSEGGGNINDLDMSSMSEASSDTMSQASSLPSTPRDECKVRRSSRINRSSESSSIADDSGCAPLE